MDGARYEGSSPQPGLEQPEQSGSREEMMELVYAELRALAAAHLRLGERPGHTLSPTAVVHEAYLRLRKARSECWSSREHFFAAAASAIRRILIDHARRRGRLKRGGGRRRLTLSDTTCLTHDERDIDLLDLETALAELGGLDARSAQMVELRFFGGLTVPEAARVLGVSERTVHDDWHFARAWLSRRLDGTALP